MSFLIHCNSSLAYMSVQVIFQDIASHYLQLIFLTTYLAAKCCWGGRDVKTLNIYFEENTFFLNTQYKKWTKTLLETTKPKHFLCL